LQHLGSFLRAHAALGAVHFMNDEHGQHMFVQATINGRDRHAARHIRESAFPSASSDAWSSSPVRPAIYPSTAGRTPATLTIAARATVPSSPFKANGVPKTATGTFNAEFYLLHHLHSQLHSCVPNHVRSFFSFFLLILFVL